MKSSWHWALIKVWRVHTSYSQHSGAWDCPCWNKMESTVALFQAKAPFIDFRTWIKICHTNMPLFSHASPLSVSTADLEYLKANATLSSHCFLWTSACDVFTINTYKDEVTVTPSTLGCGSHGPRSSPSPWLEHKRTAIWKLILNKVQRENIFVI